MKRMKVLLFVASLTLVGACGKKGEYVDVNTGKTVTLEKDAETGYMVNVETKKPVYIYTSRSSGDTIYGRTGKVINSNVVKLDDGHFEYKGDGEYSYVNGEYKKKVDDDGSFKVKDGDYKLKVDEDGSSKIKNGDYKKKVDDDGDIKIKDGDTKIKIKAKD